MKQDVNFLLLGLIIVVLVGMVSMAIYAQYEYSGLNVRYASAIRELSNKSAELEQKERLINETQAQLLERERAFIDLVRAQNLSNETAKSMQSFYQDMKGQKEILEANLNATNAEKEKYRTNYITAQKDLQVCQERSRVEKEQLEKEKAKGVALQNQLRDTSTYLNKTKIQLAGINKEIRDISSALDSLSNDAAALPDQIGSTERTKLRRSISSIQSSVDDLDRYLSAALTSISEADKKIGGTS